MIQNGKRKITCLVIHPYKNSTIIPGSHEQVGIR